MKLIDRLFGNKSEYRICETNDGKFRVECRRKGIINIGGWILLNYNESFDAALGNITDYIDFYKQEEEEEHGRKIKKVIAKYEDN